MKFKVGDKVVLKGEGGELFDCNIAIATPRHLDLNCRCFIFRINQILKEAESVALSCTLCGIKSNNLHYSNCELASELVLALYE